VAPRRLAVKALRLDAAFGAQVVKPAVTDGYMARFVGQYAL